MTQEVLYKHKEKLICCKTDGALEQVPREAVESSLEMLKTPLGSFLYNILQGICFGKGAEIVDSP